MIVFTRRDLAYVRPALRERLRGGELALLPTDGGYAIFGNALLPRVRARLARWRGRGEPVVMVPHALEWARLVVAPEHRAGLEEAVARHAGTDCLAWPHAGPSAPLPPELVPSGVVTLRFPRHWVRDLAGELTFPLLCVPVPGGMTRLDELRPAVARQLDFTVYEGPRPAVAPRVVRLGEPPAAQGGSATCQQAPTSAPSRTPPPSGRGRSAARRGTSSGSGRSRASRSRPASS